GLERFDGAFDRGGATKDEAHAGGDGGALGDRAGPLDPDAPPAAELFGRSDRDRSGTGDRQQQSSRRTRRGGGDEARARDDTGRERGSEGRKGQKVENLLGGVPPDGNRSVRFTPESLGRARAQLTGAGPKAKRLLGSALRERVECVVGRFDGARGVEEIAAAI